MTKDKNIEKKLLAPNEIDELISKKLKNEIEQELKAVKKVKKRIIEKDFKAVPSDMTFSKQCVYIAFNRNTKTESYINGVQADSLIGMKRDVRAQLLEKSVDSFSNGDYFVKFNSYSYFE